MRAQLSRLFQHQAWADREILAALNDSDPRLAPATKLFGHIAAGESIWLSRISGRATECATPWQELSLELARDLANSNARGFLEFVEDLTEDRLSEILDYRTSKGDPMSTPLGDILLHVALHGSYHRGQIAAQLGALGLATPSTDFVIFSRLNPPHLAPA